MTERITRDPDGSLDEIACDGGAHIEHLGGKRWFLSFVFADGSEHCLWITGKITSEEAREPAAPRGDP